MTTRRPVSWFMTERGRKFSFGIITATGIGFSLARFVPHTFMIDYYKDFVHYYSNGKKADLPKELRDMCTQCLDILSIPEIHCKLIKPFSVFGYDLFHAGSSFSKYGVAVGIPKNFMYKSLDDVQKDDIKVNMKSVDWNSEAGQKLADALILPEKVQQFAICREILMTQNNKAIYESIYPFTCVFAVYTMAQLINRRLNLYVAPTMVRATIYSILGTFGIGTYFLMKDMTEVNYESEVDKALCELGTDFIEAGVIFYDKLLKQNQALRELMGREGEKKYSMLGNENFGLRHPRIALVHRKQFFEEMLKEKKSSEENVIL